MNLNIVFLLDGIILEASGLAMENKEVKSFRTTYMAPLGEDSKYKSLHSSKTLLVKGTRPFNWRP